MMMMIRWFCPDGGGDGNDVGLLDLDDTSITTRSADGTLLPLSLLPLLPQKTAIARTGIRR